MGDVALPKLEDNCIGKIILALSAPIFMAMPGTNGPKEKNEALPLPISIEAPKIRMVITMPIPIAPKPKCCDNPTRLLINPRLISPYEKISAEIISVITVAKTFPMASQKTFIELKISGSQQFKNIF